VIDRRQMMAMTAASALAPTVLAGPACGQASAGWPARPVRLIVPYAPGGPTDSVARLVADSLSRTWGQQVVIENKGGAGTNIGADLVAHADPDGYTMLIGSGALAINRNLYRTLTYDAVADFAPVVHICGFSFFMLVPVSSPARSVKDFVALANERKGKMTFASPGTGSPPHLGGELLKHLTKIEMTHVPYRGASPAFTDLIAGRVDLFFGSGISVEQVKAGKLRALAVTTAARLDVLPDVSTVGEFVPGYEASGFAGIGAPRNTPAAIITLLNQELNAGLADSKIRAHIVELGGTVLGGSPAEFGAIISEPQKSGQG